MSMSPPPPPLLLPLRLGTRHIVRMPTETSLTELGLAAGSSHYAFRRPQPGELLHQHFEEIVVNGAESASRIVSSLLSTASSTCTTSSTSSTSPGYHSAEIYFDQLGHYRDPYFEYQLDQLMTAASRFNEEEGEEEEKKEFGCTEAEKALMQQIYQEFDSRRLQLSSRQAQARERRARLKKEAALNGGDRDESTKNHNHNHNSGGKRKATPSAKRVTKKLAIVGLKAEAKTEASDFEAKLSEAVALAQEDVKSEEEENTKPLPLSNPVSTKQRQQLSRGPGKRTRFLALSKAGDKEVGGEEAAAAAMKKPQQLKRRRSKKVGKGSPAKPQVLVKKEEPESDDLDFDLKLQVKKEKEEEEEDEDEDAEFNEEEENGGGLPLTAAQRRRKVARDRKRAQTERIMREETPAERELRLSKQRERQRRFYAKETAEQRARRLDKVRQYQMARKMKLQRSSNSSMMPPIKQEAEEEGGGEVKEGLYFLLNNHNNNNSNNSQVAA